MKVKLLCRALLVPAAALVSLPALSQELTLFQDDGGGRGFTQGVPAALAAAVAAPSAPPVTLKGIYRFGDTYRLSLQTGEGGAVQTVTWRSDESNPPVFNGYQIQVVSSRNVTLALPAGTSCQADLQNGGNCIGRNQMSLTFAQTDPVSGDRRFQQRRGDDDDRRRNNNNDNNEWWAQGNNVNVNDIRQLIEASGGIRALAEAQFRGRGGNANAANAGGRGGRGGANNGGRGNNNGGRGNVNGGRGNNNGGGGGGRGGGPRGNGQ